MEQLSDSLPAAAPGPDEAAIETVARGATGDGARDRDGWTGAMPVNVAKLAVAGRGRADSWGSNLPPLRLAARTKPDAAAPPSEPPVPITPAGDDIDLAPPPSLRTTRAAAGVLLLLAGWIATVGCFALGQLVFGGFPQQQALLPRIALEVATALAALWVGVVALACIVAGAFALALAIRSRGW